MDEAELETPSEEVAQGAVEDLLVVEPFTFPKHWI